VSERKNGLKSKDLKKLRKLSENRKKKTKRMEYHLGKGKKSSHTGAGGEHWLTWRKRMSILLHRNIY
jgi:hypothetical protein